MIVRVYPLVRNKFSFILCMMHNMFVYIYVLHMVFV